MKEIQKRYTVFTYHMDKNQQVSLVALCGFLQETAAEHADLLGFGYENMKKSGKVWVMSRMRIEIEKYPKWNDTLAVQTWINDRPEKYFSYRDFAVFDASGQNIANATISWALIDIEKRRPAVIADHVNLSEIHVNKYSLSTLPPKLQTLPSVDATENRRVKYSDIDLLNHMNNLRYAEWLLDSVSPDFIEHKEVAVYEINYMNEALLNDNLTLKTHFADSRQTLHALARIADDKEICRMQVVWRNTHTEAQNENTQI